MSPRIPLLRLVSAALLVSCLSLVACSSSDDDVSDTSAGTDTDSTDLSSTEAALNFLALLSDDELSTAQLEFSDSEARTVWSNLPIIGPQNTTVERNGLQFSDLSDEALAAALTVAQAVLSESGYEDFVGTRAADDYLAAAEGSDALFSSGNYFIAILGEPSDESDWQLQIGGHHMAYNITYLEGAGYPMPAFVAIEPRGEFEQDGVTYDPMNDETATLVAVFDSLSADELSNAYLTGETFSDILVGPDDGSGILPTDSYPASGNRGGVFVSSLTEDQQALVVAAIESYVSDYPDSVSESLLEAYTSDEAFADTLVAWAGTESAGVDLSVTNTYVRIDGPRLWIELASPNGFVFTDETHYHSIYRDKELDYGNSL